MNQLDLIYRHFEKGSAKPLSSSLRRVLNENFAGLSSRAAEFWPFDFAAQGYQTTYDEIQPAASPDPLRDPRGGICVTAHIFNEHEQLLLQQSVYMEDDCLTVNIDNLYRISGRGEQPFAPQLVHKLNQFIGAQDRQRRDAASQPSQITLEAVSNSYRLRQLQGGFIWAVQGFDFASAQDLQQVRRNFQAYAQRQGVSIKDKDLQYFCKPCHFAAFHCGIWCPDRWGGHLSLIHI